MKNRKPYWKRLLALSLTPVLLAGCTGGSMSLGKIDAQADGKTDVSAPPGSLVSRMLALETVRNPEQNVILSPLSIEAALGMSTYGLSDEGKKSLETLFGVDVQTAQTALQSYLAGKTDDTLSIANSMWYNESLKDVVSQSFQETLINNYHAETGSFQANSAASAKTINDWVSQQTRQRINGIVAPDGSSLKDDTLALLINALYFDGKWMDPFDDPGSVQEGTFHSPQGDRTVSFLTGEERTYFETDQATAFAKAYEDGYEFIGILPKGETFELSGLDLEELLASRTEAYDVDIRIPKFELEYSACLKDTLTNLGLGSLFAEGSMNGMLTENSGMTAQISDVVHKTYMRMYEDGTEAAAVTGIFYDCLAAVPDAPQRERKEVFLDRPFAFLILDPEAEQTVFAGMISDLPSISGETPDSEPEQKAFLGTVVDEDHSSMIVEPAADQEERQIADRITLHFPTEHYDYLYGKGRKIVVYYQGEISASAPEITTEDISTEGFREFSLAMTPAAEPAKIKILDNQDILGDAFRYSLYYYGMDQVEITVDGSTIPLAEALKQGKMTLNGLVAQANKDVSAGKIESVSYDDGGSILFRYPDYTLIKYHTLDGNRDVYIGTPDMDIQIANT